VPGVAHGTATANRARPAYLGGRDKPGHDEVERLGADSPCAVAAGRGTREGMKRLIAPALFAVALAVPSSLLAWGNTGHRMIGELAIRALPTEAPAFLRTAQAARDVGELS